MAKVTTDLTVVIKTAGDAGLDKLTRTLNGLGRQAKSAAAPFDQISKELKDVQRTSKNSIANLRGYRNAWRDITEQVEIGSAAFKEATAEAARLDKQLQKAEGRKGPGGSGRLRAAAQVAGTVAGAGVFGGPEGAAGALLGSIGGPGGAIVGGAIGAQVGQLRQAVGATAEYSASLEKLRIALFGVTTSQQEYQQSLEFITKTSDELAIPQDILTKQFTKLQASVLGAGGSVEDTKLAFRGIVAAVRATGGSLQDVDSALTATAQVFSKGKVSAEELRQQIGERLPGAFTQFAESIGKTPQELDKALEQGEVSLEDFLTFTKAIFDRYDKNAQVIVNSPSAAGDRLQQKLKKLQEAVGILVAPIGAEFQAIASIAVDSLTAIIKKIDELFKKFEFLTKIAGVLGEVQASALLGPVAGKLAGVAISNLGREADEEVDIRKGIQQPDPGTGLPKAGDTETDKTTKNAGKLSKFYRQAQREFDRFVKELERGDKLSLKLLTKATQNNALLGTRNKLEKINTQFAIDTSNVLQKYQNILSGNLTEEAKINLERAKGLELTNLEVAKREDLKNLFAAAGKDFADFAIKQNQELTETDKLVKSIESTLATSMADAIEGLIDGTKSLSESLSGVLRQVASLLLNFGTKSLVGSFFADGGVVAQNKIVPFASGGVVNKPTIFPMANGMGLMGEAGPEAIMPLRRGANGKLGVEASGGVGNVVVNVDASGSNVEGDQEQSKQLGQLIGAAVQAELVKQKRPGGLLN